MANQPPPMSLRDRHKVIDEEAKRKDLINQITLDYETYGKQKMKRVKSTNIMIVGRTRSGKSTIKSLLLDPTKVPDELTLKSGTRDPHIESFHVTDIDATLNIIDTPGLFERGNGENSIRDNETILKTIEKCANMEITSFNVICFCVAITAGINGEDVKSIELFMTCLGNEISSNSCLIITHCESKRQEQHATMKRELENDTFFKEIAPFFKLGVFFSGSINRDNYNNGNDCVIDEYVTISEYRAQLIKLFTSDIKPFPITETRISEIRHANESKAMALNELENAQNLCKQKELTNEDLQRKSAMRERTVEDLQGNREIQKLTINDLRRKCQEMQRTIDDYERECKQQRSRIKDFQKNAEQEKCFIVDILQICEHRQIRWLMQKYPNYFPTNDDARSQADDNYHKYPMLRYK